MSSAQKAYPCYCKFLFCFCCEGNPTSMVSVPKKHLHALTNTSLIERKRAISLQSSYLLFPQQIKIRTDVTLKIFCFTRTSIVYLPCVRNITWSRIGSKTVSFHWWYHDDRHWIFCHQRLCWLWPLASSCQKISKQNKKTSKYNLPCSLQKKLAFNETNFSF